MFVEDNVAVIFDQTSVVNLTLAKTLFIAVT